MDMDMVDMEMDMDMDMGRGGSGRVQTGQGRPGVRRSRLRRKAEVATLTSRIKQLDGAVEGVMPSLVSVPTKQMNKEKEKSVLTPSFRKTHSEMVEVRRTETP